jgi:hypothetical protein
VSTAPVHARPAGAAPQHAYPRLPPISEVAVATIATVVVGGIYLAAHLPRRPPLGPAFAILGVAVVLLVVDVVWLSRIQTFAWDKFFLVGKWAVFGYLIEAGMLEYVFVLDHTRGPILLVLTLMLAIFGVTIPMLLAFTVARYQPVDPVPNRQP